MPNDCSRAAVGPEYYVANSDREKLAKVKGEKKVLIAELRALREMGLYQGPLTRDGHEFGGETGPRQSGDNTPPKHTAPSAIENMVEEDGGMEHEKLQYQVILLELEERKRVIQSMLKADPGAEIFHIIHIYFFR